MFCTFHDHFFHQLLEVFFVHHCRCVCFSRPYGKLAPCLAVTSQACYGPFHVSFQTVSRGRSLGASIAYTPSFSPDRPLAPSFTLPSCFLCRRPCAFCAFVSVQHLYQYRLGPDPVCWSPPEDALSAGKVLAMLSVLLTVAFEAVLPNAAAVGA